MPGVDVGLILFLLKIVKLSGGIYPAAGSCHMVYKSCCVRRNKVQLLWKRKCRITADPVQLIRNLSADAFLSNVAGIVAKSTAVEIAEYNLVLIHGQQIADLPHQPDIEIVEAGIDTGQHRI